MNKNALMTLCGSILLGVALVAPSAFAGDEAQQNSGAATTLATTASSGIVSEAGPDSIAVATTRSPKPVTYHSNETTTWVDQSGNPVDPAAVKPGMPVTVYYSQSGSKLVAAKVVVKTETAPAQPRG